MGRGEEGEVNRSQVDFHVMVELILRGWAKDQIFAVFKSPDFGISAKYFEEGGNGEHYLKATYDSAAAKAATEITQWGLIGDVLDFQSAQDLAKAPDLTFAVESLVPTGGMMILSGASKAGKSMLVSDLMLLLAGCKGKFLEHFDVLTPGPVVYCQAEIGQPSLKKRLNLIAHSRKVVWSQLPIHFFHGPFRLDFDLHLSSLRKGLEKVKAKYLIVDPLARYHLSNENSQMDMARVLRNFENVGKDAGLAGLILVHHHGKPSGDSPREGAHKTRGHSIIGDWANSHVVLNKLWSDSAQRKYIRIVFELRDADEPDPMTLQLDRKQLRFVKFSENDEKLGIALTIIKANGRVPENGKERREVVEEISEKLGTSLKTAEAFLGRASRIFQDGTGDNLPDEPGSGD